MSRGNFHIFITFLGCLYIFSSNHKKLIQKFKKIFMKNCFLAENLPFRIKLWFDSKLMDQNKNEFNKKCSQLNYVQLLLIKNLFLISHFLLRPPNTNRKIELLNLSVCPPSSLKMLSSFQRGYFNSPFWLVKQCTIYNVVTSYIFNTIRVVLWGRIYLQSGKWYTLGVHKMGKHIW